MAAPIWQASKDLRRIRSIGDNLYVKTISRPTTTAGGMNPDPETQREVLLRKAVLAGDEAAWRQWCLENFDPLDRFVLWRCGCRRDEADEIVQETWLVAVRQMRRFNPEQGRFLAWLRGIAANVRRNQLRHRRRQARSLQNGSDEPVDEVASPAIGESSVEEERHRAEQIAAVLDALPERQEAVLRSKYLDGLSVNEIAAQWNETPKAIESLLTRARQAFRERFEKVERAD